MVSGLALVAAVLFLIAGILYVVNKNVAMSLIAFGLTALSVAFGF